MNTSFMVSFDQCEILIFFCTKATKIAGFAWMESFVKNLLELHAADQPIGAEISYKFSIALLFCNRDTFFGTKPMKLMNDVQL